MLTLLDSTAGLGAAVGGIILFSLVLGIGGFILGIIMWWKIFSKAGFDGARAFLLLIPIVNLIIMLTFAFGEWPIHRELNALRQQAAMRGQPQYPQGPQMSSNPQYPQYPQNQGYR